MSQAMRKLTGAIAKSKTSVIFINQIREKIGVMFGSPETTPGGRALKFYCSCRIDVRRIGTLKDGEEVVGQRVRAKVVKNKVAPPFRVAEFDMMHSDGISYEGDMLDLALAAKLVEKTALVSVRRHTPRPRPGEGPAVPQGQPRGGQELREKILASQGGSARRREGDSGEATADAERRRRASSRVESGSTQQRTSGCTAVPPSSQWLRGSRPCRSRRQGGLRRFQASCGTVVGCSMAASSAAAWPAGLPLAAACGVRYVCGPDPAPEPLHAMKADELREAYLTFFESKGCVRRPSDVLVPRWDPSVLFTPAGMNQFKDHFLGKCKLEFTRATTCQKCLRTGDIDNVGRTAQHHTFFEMLGNFSFGDYFKREAIHWAWEFLTAKTGWASTPRQLSITVYQDDDEAYAIWSDEIGLPPTKITRMGEDDNFWPASAPSQGPDGVCGPCSEIFYHDARRQRGGDLEPRVHAVQPRGRSARQSAAAAEQEHRHRHGSGTNLPRCCRESRATSTSTSCGRSSKRRRRSAADSTSRTATTAGGCDGSPTMCGPAPSRSTKTCCPGNNEEKYVVKRLLRRAVLDGHQMGMREPFLHKLVPRWSPS